MPRPVIVTKAVFVAHDDIEKFLICVRYLSYHYDMKIDYSEWLPRFDAQNTQPYHNCHAMFVITSPQVAWKKLVKDMTIRSTKHRWYSANGSQTKHWLNSLLKLKEYSDANNMRILKSHPDVRMTMSYKDSY